MSSARPAFAAALLLASVSGAGAQSVTDGSDAAIAPEDTRAVLALIGQRLRAPDALVTQLRRGRAGALCGAVELRNRMGTYTGARGFVADLARSTVGRLPEGPELRNPGSMAEFRAMEETRRLFAENCTAE